MTAKSCSFIGTVQKHMPAPTLAATKPNPLAVMFKRSVQGQIRLISGPYPSSQLPPKHNFQSQIIVAGEFQNRQ